jgi:hypothetical protein
MMEQLARAMEDAGIDVSYGKKFRGGTVDVSGKLESKNMMVFLAVRENIPILTSSVIGLYQVKKRNNGGIFVLASENGAYGDVGEYAESLGMEICKSPSEFRDVIKKYL